MLPPRLQRILFCEGNTDGTIGGSYFSLLFLVSGLDPARFQPVVVFYSDNFVAQQMRDKGIDVRILKVPPANGLRSRVRRLWAEWTTAREYARLLRQEGIGLVHVNNSLGQNQDWMLAAMLAKVPCICHERDWATSFSRRTRWMAARLDRIIAISKAVQDNLLSQGIQKTKIQLIYNGIDPEVVRPRKEAEQVRAEWNLQGASLVIGIVGNVAEWKGQATVVDALAILKQRFPGIVCLLVGDIPKPEQAFGERLREQIRALHLGDNIRFTGYQKYPADFMNVMDVVLHASINPEPFGRVIVEAMALSKPVVGSRAGGVTEIVVEGKSGLLFTPGNAQELAACVTRIVEDPEQGRTMGIAGRERVDTHFHIQRNVERTMEVYETLLADNSK